MHDKTRLALYLGLISNVILAAAKIGVGILAHSPALLAEGINSTSDVTYYVLASVFIRLAQKPADDEHPYGHQQLESVATLLVGAFVVTTGVAVFWNAIDKAWDLWQGIGTFEGAGPAAIWVALMTIAVKIFLTVFIRHLGHETHNPVVEAMAYDHRNDLLSASAATLGIFLGQRGLPWVDPFAAALVAVLIFRTGLEIVLNAANALMDTVPSEKLVREVLKVVKTVSPRVHLEEVRAHRFGPQLVINLTIGIDGELSIYEGDRLSSLIEKRILQHLTDVQHVHVHYHPSRPDRRDLSAEQVLAFSRLPWQA